MSSGVPKRWFVETACSRRKGSSSECGQRRTAPRVQAAPARAGRVSPPPRTLHVG